MTGASTARGDRKTPRRHLPGGRWGGVVLRALHLAAVIGLGAAVHGAPLDPRSIGIVVASTGILLFAIDLYTYPQHLREVAGLSVIVKLLLVAALILIDAFRVPLFWIVVVWSVIFSHAPGSLRHRRVIEHADPSD